MNVPLLIKNGLRSISQLTDSLGRLIDDADEVKFENFNRWLFCQYFHVIFFCFICTDPEVRTPTMNMSNFRNNLMWIKEIKVGCCICLHSLPKIIILMICFPSVKVLLTLKQSYYIF